MNKAVMLSIQPYYVFLIIARLMGWNIPQEKTVEVRKDYPKASDWNKRVHIYCSKNKKSFNRIPKEYQPLMKKFLGMVIGEFVCDGIVQLFENFEDVKRSCLSWEEIQAYAKGKPVYGWHISDLKIYDTPKGLGEFNRFIECENRPCFLCKYSSRDCNGILDCDKRITRPFQSWGYVDAL